MKNKKDNPYWSEGKYVMRLSGGKKEVAGVYKTPKEASRWAAKMKKMRFEV